MKGCEVMFRDMNLSTIIVLLIIIAISIFAISKVRKKGGCVGCSHSEEGCSSCHSSNMAQDSGHSCCSHNHGKEINLNKK